MLWKKETPALAISAGITIASCVALPLSCTKSETWSPAHDATNCSDLVFVYCPLLKETLLVTVISFAIVLSPCRLWRSILAPITWQLMCWAQALVWPKNGVFAVANHNLISGVNGIAGFLPFAPEVNVIIHPTLAPCSVACRLA